MTKRKTTEQFIIDARKVHGDKFDYSKAEYHGNKIPITIICPKHGEFQQIPNNHLHGKGCPKCKAETIGNLKRMSKEAFIAKAQKSHGNKYDYSKVDMENRDEQGRIYIICPIHGEFWQLPNDHMRGCGCDKCANVRKKTTEEFIAEARKIHGDKYDYLKVAYFNNKTPVIITCPKHGDFKMTPKNHLKGQGCHKCYTEWWSQHLRLTTEEFIEKARKVHGAKYDYSGVNYIDTETPITIICSTHGPFHQKPHYHLAGCGCPYCIQSNLEEQIATLLKETQIEYEEQKLFSWLKNKKAMKLDFYLPQYKLAIECQGCQHFYPVSLFGGFKAYQQTVKRDRLKYELCQEHGIPILYFSLPQDAPSDYLSDIYTNKARLLEEIYRYGTKQRDTGFIQDCTNTVRGTNTLGTVN